MKKTIFMLLKYKIISSLPNSTALQHEIGEIVKKSILYHQLSKQMQING